MKISKYYFVEMHETKAKLKLSLIQSSNAGICSREIRPTGVKELFILVNEQLTNNNLLVAQSKIEIESGYSIVLIGSTASLISASSQPKSFALFRKD